MIYQRQRWPKDVPKTETLREDVRDADSKDKDTKDKLDVFLMSRALHITTGKNLLKMYINIYLNNYIVF